MGAKKEARTVEMRKEDAPQEGIAEEAPKEEVKAEEVKINSARSVASLTGVVSASIAPPAGLRPRSADAKTYKAKKDDTPNEAKAHEATAEKHRKDEETSKDVNKNGVSAEQEKRE